MRAVFALARSSDEPESPKEVIRETHPASADDSSNSVHTKELCKMESVYDMFLSESYGWRLQRDASCSIYARKMRLLGLKGILP
jgi:hypothetical protein